MNDDEYRALLKKAKFRGTTESECLRFPKGMQWSILLLVKALLNIEVPAGKLKEDTVTIAVLPSSNGGLTGIEVDVEATDANNKLYTYGIGPLDAVTYKPFFGEDWPRS